MNIVSLVGRLAKEPEVKEQDDGTVRTLVTLAVSRDYKNSDGKIDADFIKVVLWNGVASATKDYCHKGDVIGVRGKLQTSFYETSKNEKKYVLDVVADKVTFISKVVKKA